MEIHMNKVKNAAARIEPIRSLQVLKVKSNKNFRQECII